MKLSIIVPIYNVENYLPKCLDSLMNQTFQDYELILVNDGSQDRSLSIMESAQTNDPKRIKIFTKENGGLSDARNFGIKQSSGDYLAFIDSDDYIDVNMFSKMINLALNEACDVVVCGMNYIYEDGTQRYASGGEFDFINPQTNLNVLTINNSACNKIYKKGLFNTISFPKGKWYEDLATIPIVLYHAKKIGNIHDSLYFYYQRSGSIAHRKHQKMFEIYEAIDNVHQSLRPEVNDQDELDRKIGNLYITHGLFLTTLRIKEIENLQERSRYLKENIAALMKYYPTWTQDNSLKTYGIKNKIVFKLLSWGKFMWVARIYR